MHFLVRERKQLDLPSALYGSFACAARRKPSPSLCRNALLQRGIRISHVVGRQHCLRHMAPAWLNRRVSAQMQFWIWMYHRRAESHRVHRVSQGRGEPKRVDVMPQLQIRRSVCLYVQRVSSSTYAPTASERNSLRSLAPCRVHTHTHTHTQGATGAQRSKCTSHLQLIAADVK